MADKVAVLNAGRLEQLGTPEAVYHTPLTPFVADFVGQADFLPGKVGPDGLIDTEIARFPNEEGFQEGASLAVMIRPDDIHLVAAPGGLGTVLTRQFKGSENLYAVSLPSGQLLHASEHSVTVYSPGTRVELKLRATHTVLFKSLDMLNTIIP